MGRQYNFANKYQLRLKGFEWQSEIYMNDERNGGQITAKHDSMPLYKPLINNTKWDVYSKSGYVLKTGWALGL